MLSTDLDVVLELPVDVLLPTRDLLQSLGDLVVQLVEVALCVAQGALDPLLVLMHLLHVHPPVLEQSSVCMCVCVFVCAHTRE